jgi:hypothetical protein
MTAGQRAGRRRPCVVRRSPIGDDLRPGDGGAGGCGIELGDGALPVPVHAWPAWEALSFLSGDTTRVLPSVDALSVAGIAVGLLQMARPRGASVPAGTLLTTVSGLAATVGVLQVFPSHPGSGWEVVVRVVLRLGIVGAVVGIPAAFVAQLRLRAARRWPARAGGPGGRDLRPRGRGSRTCERRGRRRRGRTHGREQDTRPERGGVRPAGGAGRGDGDHRVVLDEPHGGYRRRSYR